MEKWQKGCCVLAVCGMSMIIIGSLPVLGIEFYDWVNMFEGMSSYNITNVTFFEGNSLNVSKINATDSIVTSTMNHSLSCNWNNICWANNPPAPWNSTNTTYALNATLATMAWNQTNASYALSGSFWNTQFNSSNISAIYVNTTNITGIYGNFSVLCNLTYCTPNIWNGGGSGGISANATGWLNEKGYNGSWGQFENLTFSGLASGSVPYASAYGFLAASPNMTFNGNTLTLGGSSNQIPQIVLNPMGSYTFNLVSASTPGSLYVAPNYGTTGNTQLFFVGSSAIYKLNLFAKPVGDNYVYYDDATPIGLGYPIHETVPAYFAVKNMVTGAGTISTPSLPGTVSTTSGETAVTGSGTTFLSTFSVGDKINIDDLGQSSVIAGITSDTLLAITDGADDDISGSAYSSNVIVGSGTSFLTSAAAASRVYYSGASYFTVATSGVVDNTHLRMTTSTGTLASTAYSINKGDALQIVPSGARVANIGINTAPTAQLHLAAGTATASTAQMKFASSTLMTTPESGALEYRLGNLYLTNSTPYRKAVITNETTWSIGTTGSVSVGGNYTFANGWTVQNTTGNLTFWNSTKPTMCLDWATGTLWVEGCSRKV